MGNGEDELVNSFLGIVTIILRFQSQSKISRKQAIKEIKIYKNDTNADVDTLIPLIPDLKGNLNCELVTLIPEFQTSVKAIVTDALQFSVILQ